MPARPALLFILLLTACSASDLTSFQAQATPSLLPPTGGSVELRWSGSSNPLLTIEGAAGVLVNETPYFEPLHLKGSAAQLVIPPNNTQQPRSFALVLSTPDQTQTLILQQQAVVF